MLDDEQFANRNRLGAKVQSAVNGLPPELRDKFHAQAYESPLIDVLDKLYVGDWDHPGVELAVNLASFREPIPIMMKDYVRRALQDGWDSILLDVKTAAIEETADLAFKLIVNSSGNLKKFLEWLLNEPERVRMGGERYDLFQPFDDRPYGEVIGRYREEEGDEGTPISWDNAGAMLVPDTFEGHFKEFLEYVEKDFIENSLIPYLGMEYGDRTYTRRCLSVLKAMGEWIWARVVENEACKETLRVVCPNMSQALQNLHVAALGGGYTESTEDWEAFQANSPTIGIGMLSLNPVIQSLLLGLRVSSEDFVEGTGDPFPLVVVAFLVMLDQEKELKQRNFPLDRDLSSQSVISDSLLRVYREGLPRLCINAAVIADFYSGPASGSDEVVDAFREVELITRDEKPDQRAIQLLQLGQRLAVEEKFKPLDVKRFRVIGEEYSGSLSPVLVSLCDYVWRKATNRSSLRLADLDEDYDKTYDELKRDRNRGDPHGPDDPYGPEIDNTIPLGLKHLGFYEELVKLRPGELPSKFTNPSNVQQLVALGLFETADDAQRTEALKDYPFFVEDDGVIYRDPPQWEALVKLLDL